MDIQGKEIALYLSGQPVPIPECNIVMSQPKIKEVVLFGEDDFLMMCQMLAHTDKFLAPIKQGNSELEMIPDFQILMIVMNQDEKVRRSMEEFLDLIFPSYKIAITEKNIEFYTKDEKMVGMINPMNFEKIQVIIDKLFMIHSDSDEIEYNPANEKAEKIAKKLKKGREKVKQIKAQAQGNSSLFGTYTSVLSIGLAIDINILYNYTPFQLYDAFTRY